MKSFVLRRLSVALAVACLVIPAWSLATRALLHFVADFDQQISGGTDTPDFLAKGGVFVTQGPPGVFDIALDGTGEGLLVVGENVFQTPAVLTGELDEPAYNSIIDVEFILDPAGPVSGLVVSFVDDNGGGMIDLEFEETDGGKVNIGGHSLVLSGGSTNDTGDVGPLHFALCFKSTLLNVNTWQLTLTNGLSSQAVSGFLPLTGPLSLAKVKLLRPGSSEKGTWTMDDLVIASPFDTSLVVQ
ncbi:MAG: hypothetical protein ACI9EF_003596 [Pseudohongiellaceae bacterium]|jgi:hypothetical protein